MVVQAMLDQKPVVGGFAYRAQMRASGEVLLLSLRTPPVLVWRTTFCPAILWLYDSNPFAGHQLPGAPMKYMCCASFSARLQQAFVVRAPFDIIIEDGLLIVATTHKRIQGRTGSCAVALRPRLRHPGSPAGWQTEHGGGQTLDPEI